MQSMHVGEEAQGERLECGHYPSPHGSVGGTGYGTDTEGRRFCYACCGTRDRAEMEREGRIMLYLVGSGSTPWKVTNWPGTLQFHPRMVRESRHNMAGVRRDVWFAGPGGWLWHGVQIGENSQICRCKRTKQHA